MDTNDFLENNWACFSNTVEYKRNNHGIGLEKYFYSKLYICNKCDNNRLYLFSTWNRQTLKPKHYSFYEHGQYYFGSTKLMVEYQL